MQLVLRGAGQRDVALDAPHPAALVIFAVRTIGLVLGQACTLDLLDLLERRHVDTVRIVHPAGGIADGHDLRAQLLRFFDRIDRHVARTADSDGLARKALATHLEHLGGEVDEAVAGRFRPGQRAAVGQALAGQHALITVGQALVLAEQITDLAPADADIARRHVGVRTDVAVKLRHEALAEGHDLAVGLTLGIEIRAALAAADRQTGQRVFEDLLEPEEFDDAEIDRRMQPQTALVRTDGGVELHAVAAVDMRLALVIHPRHTEQDRTLRLDQPLEQARLFVRRFGLDHGAQGIQHLRRRLQELLLFAVMCFQLVEHSIDICHRSTSFPVAAGRSAAPDGPPRPNMPLL